MEPSGPGALLTFVALAARWAGPVFLLPAIGGPRIPTAVRTGLVLLLALVTLPTADPILTGESAARTVLTQALFGVSTAALLLPAFEVARMAGGTIGAAIGRAAASGMTGAAGRAADDPIGTFYHWAFVAIFVAIGGHIVTLHLLHAGLRWFGTVDLLTLWASATWLEASVAVAGAAVISAIGLAFPVVATALVLDLSLGLAQRYIPSWQVFFVALPLRLLVGVFVVAGLLGLVAVELTTFARAWTEVLLAAVGAG